MKPQIKPNKVLQVRSLQNPEVWVDWFLIQTTHDVETAINAIIKDPGAFRIKPDQS